ncbi:hypothetical protein [Lysobacter terrae]
MRPIGTLLLALLLASPVALAGDGPAPTAKSLLSRIAKDGGRKVLWDLWEHEKDFGRMLAGIESGDAAWLQVATALHPFADAGAALSLDYAVALALPKAPSRVLALVGHGFAVDDICTSPFIEPEPGIAEAYEREALAALSTVKAPALAPVAAECSKRVRLPDGT